MTQREDQAIERLREVTLALRKTLDQRDALLHERSEPIAVVGIGCRFPGGASSPAAFRDLLEAGRDAVQSLDPRWALVGARPGDEVPRWAGLLTEPVDCFDASFFGISPREAKSLDPQHRLLLEVAWEALEEAGIPAASLEGSRTGVFAGAIAADYARLVEQQPPEQWDAYGATGNLLSVVAGRLSYTMGLQGPCLTVDTACSSSLVAVHLACRSLRSRECDVALAGGVCLLLSPTGFEMFSRTQSLSPDGRCRTFDALANGFARGEGCGLVVLKRLSDAQRDGDRIWAVIRGSAMNQDGRSTGLTAPSVPAQEALLREALRDARVAPADIGYVETHGTGTSLGDPIEVEALRAVLGAPRPDGQRCVLGAVKTNVGHLEAAAGVAGLIKAAMALHHEHIPRNLHLQTANPRLRLDGTSLALATEPVPWPRGDRRRFAGVSAFGISGTNAHVILEEAPSRELAPAAPARSAELFVLSARSEAALDAQAARLHAHLEAHPELSLADVAFSLATRRSPMSHRLAVAATSREALKEALRAAARGETRPGCARGRADGGASPAVVLVFPGQGSQWSGMGRKLLAEEPVFRAAIEACDVVIRKETGWSLLAELQAGEATSQLGRIDVVQPVLFAVEVALAALWRSWGVTPASVVGHSMGEVAAAHVAGILTLADAAKVICRRSLLLRRVSGQGAMGVVELTAAEAEAALRGYADRLSVAVSNGPRSTVISGAPAALDEVLAKLEAQGVFCRRVKVDVASHSPQMDPLLDELRAALSEVRPEAARIAMWSTVTGQVVGGPDLGAGYWADNLRAPVLFSGAVQELAAGGPTLFVEISPHPVLLPAVEENLRAARRAGAAVASLRRDSDERRCLLEALGALWVRGCELDWKALHRSGDRVVSLPTYPWQRERHWVEAPVEPASAHAGRPRAAAGAHPLLGAAFSSSLHPEEHLWEQAASPERAPFLSDHRAFGEVILPGSAYIEMALAAAATRRDAGPLELAEMRFERRLLLTGGVLQLALTPGERHPLLTVASRAEGAGEWTRHATAELRPRPVEPATGLRPERPSQIRTRCPVLVEPTEHYARMVRLGIDFGPCFQGVERIWKGEGEALGQVRLPAVLAAETATYQAHPALLDACFQVVTALSPPHPGERAHVLAALSRACLYARLPAQVWAHVRGTLQNAELTILDDDGRVLMELAGLRFAPLRSTNDAWEDCVYEVAWRRRDLPGSGVAPAAPPAKQAPWVVVRDSHGTGAALASALRSRGEVAVEIDAASPQDLAGLLAGMSTCRGVVHAGSLDAAPWEETSPATLEADLRRGSLAAVLLAQAVLRRGFLDPPRLFLVTRCAQSVIGGPVAAAQAPLWGMARAIALEHPELACTRIDLPATPRPDEADLLARELCAGDGEEQIALREEGRFVARLVKSSLDAAPARPVQIRADGSYLLTGGLTGLGLSLAGWMVSRGARHLVLTGRSAPSEAALAAIHAMEEAGAEVRVSRGDVSLASDVERILGEIADSMPPLRGVVHAAAVVADRTLLQLAEEHLVATMRPKILGAWNLHTATRGLPLDFFVMYSSLSSLLGEPGQAAYAMGNAFLDAFAHARAAEGLPATSIHWGLFAGVGVAAEGDRTRRLAARGLESFTPEEGNELFGRVLEHPRAEVGLFRLSLRQWLEATPQASGMLYLSELPREQPAAPGEGAASFRAALAGEPAADRAARLEAHVIEQLGQVLRLPPSRIERRAPFTSLGLDSLMSLEARNRLERSLGLRLRATLFYTYPNAASLAEHLLGGMELPVEERAPWTGGDALPVAPEDADLLAAFDASVSGLGEEALS